MLEFPIPHIPPIRFVKSLISSDEKGASALVGFDTIPTLGMFVEAAAQSSSGIVSNNDNIEMGFLVTLKNIKLLQEPKSTTYIINVQLDYKLENFKSLSFDALDNDIVIATGSFSVAVQ